MTSKKRFTVDADLWNLLDRLADNAKMYWFYEENFRRKTIPRDDVECLTEAFIRENFRNIQVPGLFLLYNFFVRAGIADSTLKGMAAELAEYLMARGE